MYLLIGGSGAPNYGDEVILKLWLDILEGRGGEVRVETNIKKNSRDLHGDRDGIVYSDFIKRLAKNKTSLGFWHQVKRGAEFFSKGGVKVYGEKKFDFIGGLEYIHLHGGGYINKNAELNGFVLGFCYAAHKESGAKLIGTGLGLQPISQPPKELAPLAYDVFNSFSGIELRDKESFDFVISISKGEANAVLGFDDIYLLGREGFCKDSGKRRLILSFSKHNVEKFSSEYWEKVQSIKGDFDEIVFWECFPWQDRFVLDVLSGRIPEVRKIPVRESVYGSEGFSKNDYLITTRFHPHLISSRVGAKGFYYSDSKYYDVKHGSVIACGSEFIKGEFDSFEYQENFRSGLFSEIDNTHVEKKRIIVNEFLKGAVVL